MRGVSTPSHEYARVAKMYVHSLAHPNVPRDPSLEHTVRCLVASTRAYTRVVLRLRAQAEREATLASSNLSSAPSMRSASTPPSTMPRGGYVNGSGASPYYHGNGSGFISKPPSRAPSPTMSNYSHHGGGMSNGGYGMHTSQANASQTSLGFRSPLFRLRRAPLLRVFVPSPEGDWLSDKSVLECEAELQRAGVLGLVRMGDVVWDIAVGDEGNVGRMVYDGKYLIVSSFIIMGLGKMTEGNVGLGLYVQPDRGLAKIHPDSRVSTFVLPSGDTNGRFDEQPGSTYRCEPVGRGDCGQFAVVAG